MRYRQAIPYTARASDYGAHPVRFHTTHQEVRLCITFRENERHRRATGGCKGCASAHEALEIATAIGATAHHVSHYTGTQRRGTILEGRRMHIPGAAARHTTWSDSVR